MKLGSTRFDPVSVQHSFESEVLGAGSDAQGRRSSAVERTADQPRASWSELSRAIGSDPVTLTRRWERLHSQGIAWIAAYRGGPIVSATALLEIECAPAQTMSVAEQIAHDPEVLTVDLTTGNRDLLVTLTCTDLEQLSRYVLERTQSLPMITAMRTQIVSSANSDARNWRLRALDAEEIAALESAPAGKIRGVRAGEEEQSQLFDILSREHVSPSRHSLRPSESRRLALGRSFLTSCRRGDWSSARRLLGPTPAGRSTPGTSYVSTGERRQLLSAFRTCVRRGLLLLRSAATTSHWRCGCARSTTCSVWKVISPTSFRAYPWWTGRSSCVRRITCIGRSMCRVEACRSTGDPQRVRAGRVLSD